MQFQPHVEYPGLRSADRAAFKESPRHVVVIRGQKAAELEVWLGVAYSTTNEECRSQSIIGRVSGAPEVPQGFADYVLVPKGNRDFSVSFFLDRYEPGRCQWQPIATYVAEFLPSDNSGPGAVSGLTAIRAEGGKEATVDWLCHRKIDNYSGADTKWLLCLAHSPGRGNETISPNGGVICLNFDLAP